MCVCEELGGSVCVSVCTWIAVNIEWEDPQKTSAPPQVINSLTSLPVNHANKWLGACVGVSVCT